jgi:hypothetical protein
MRNGCTIDATVRARFDMLSRGGWITPFLQFRLSARNALDFGWQIHVVDSRGAVARDQRGDWRINRCDSHFIMVARVGLAHVDNSDCHVARSDYCCAVSPAKHCRRRP